MKINKFHKQLLRLRKKWINSCHIAFFQHGIRAKVNKRRQLKGSSCGEDFFYGESLAEEKKEDFIKERLERGRLQEYCWSLLEGDLSKGSLEDLFEINIKEYRYHSSLFEVVVEGILAHHWSLLEDLEIIKIVRDIIKGREESWLTSKYRIITLCLNLQVIWVLPARKSISSFSHQIS